MATEPTRELLGRELPALPLHADGSIGSADQVSAYCLASVDLINDLRARVLALENQTESGADAFNRMVRLGNQAAENIITSAHEEAARIVSSAERRAEPAPGPTRAASATAAGEDESFRDEWEREASIEERVADRAFFEDGFDEPSRSWILADTG